MLLTVATSVGLTWLALAFLRNPARATVLLAAVIALPVFLKFTSGGIALGDPVVRQSGEGQTIPLSVPALAFCLAALALRALTHKVTVRRSALSLPIAVLILANTSALLAGWLMKGQVESILYFAQTILPIIPFFLALTLVRTVQGVRRIYVAVTATLGVSAAGLVITSVVDKGVLRTLSEGPSGVIWIFPVYGLFDYFPLVLSVGYGLALSLALWPHPGSGKASAWALALLQGGAILLLHSRGALVTLFVITVAQVTFFAKDLRVRTRLAIWGALLGAVAVGVVLVLNTGSTLPTIASLRSLVVQGAEEESVRARLANFDYAVSEIARTPLIGLAYVPQSEDTFGIGRIGNPHNQYLTYGIRGGVFALLAFLLILVLICRRLYALGRSPIPEIHAAARGLLSIFVGVALISNFLQDNFIQPYSGLLLWFLMGVGEALYQNQRALRHAALSRDAPVEGLTLTR